MKKKILTCLLLMVAFVGVLLCSNLKQSSASSSSDDYFTSYVDGGTYPRLMKYDDNTLYLFTDNAYSISKDGGKTWSDRVVICSTELDSTNDDPVNDVANAFGIVSPNNDGRVIVFYRATNRDNLYFSIRCRVSDTNGENFGDYQILHTNSTGLWEPFFYEGYLYYSMEHERLGKQSQYRKKVTVFDDKVSVSVKSYLTISSAADKNINLDGEQREARIGMVSASKLKDGKHIYVFESTVNRDASISRPMVVQYAYASTPSEDAIGLINKTTLFMGDEGVACGAPTVTTLDDGKIVISFQTDQYYQGVTPENNLRKKQVVVYISKNVVNYGDNLTADDFVRINNFDYIQNDYSCWGSVINIDGTLYNTFGLGKNKSSNSTYFYTNVVKSLDVSKYFNKDELIDNLVSSYYNDVINHVAFKYSFLVEYPDYEYLSNDDFKALCIDDYSSALTYYAKLYKDVYTYSNNSSKINNYYYEFRRYPTCDTSRYLSEYDFRFLSFDEKIDYILYVIEDANFIKGIDAGLLFGNGTLDLQKDDPLYDYFCDLLLTEYENFLNSQDYLAFRDKGGFSRLLLPEFTSHLNSNGFNSALNYYFDNKKYVENYLSNSSLLTSQYRSLLNEFSSYDLSDYLSIDDFSTLSLDDKTSYFKDFLYSLAHNEGYLDGASDYYNFGYNDAIDTFLNNCNPYINWLDNYSQCTLTGVVNEGGYRASIENFDIFSNSIDSGFDLKNVIRYGNLFYKGVLKPCDIVSSYSDTYTWNDRLFLNITFKNSFYISNYNFNLTGFRKVTFILEDGQRIELNPTGYNGEISYFNITGADFGEDAIVVGIDFELSLSDCNKIAIKNDFEDVPYCTFTSVKANNEYIKGYDAGVKSTTTQHEIYIENLNADFDKEREQHALDLLVKYDEGHQLGYDSGYDVGRDKGHEMGYQSGYHDGYNAGYYVGYDDNTNNNFLGAAFISLADVPFVVLSSFLDFEVFGINYLSLLCSFLTMGLVVWLLKKFL